jgi:signal peptidase I
MSNKPKKWLAALIGICIPPIAMMYVAQWRWAVLYLVMGLAGGIVFGFVLSGETILSDAFAIMYSITGAIHAYRLAAQHTKDIRRPAYSRWYSLLGMAVGLLSMIFIFRAFVLEPFRYESGAMQPTIEPKSRFLVQKWGYGNYGAYGIQVLRKPISSPLIHGDVVAFEPPSNRSSQYAYRLIALPGDTITYRDKRLTVNGNLITQPRAEDHFDAISLTYKSRHLETFGHIEYPVLFDKSRPTFILSSTPLSFTDRCTFLADGFSCEVPPGHHFMMGDNRDDSLDSRFLGFVPADHIIGKVIFIWK